MKKIVLAVAILIAVAVSFTSAMDTYATETNRTALTQATASYVIARTINAVVSVAQSSEVQLSLAVGGSITVGEILDPINDLIERFSSVLTITLAALAIQGILINIVSTEAYGVLLAASGFVAVVSLRAHRGMLQNLALTTFGLLLFVRFAFVAVSGLNHVADNFFFTAEIAKNNAHLEQFRDDLQEREIDGAGSKKLSVDEKAKIEALQNDRDRFAKSRIVPTQKYLVEIRAKLALLEQELETEQADQSSILKPLGINDSDRAGELKSAIDKLEDEIEVYEDGLESHLGKVAAINKQISDIDGSDPSATSIMFSKVKSLGSGFKSFDLNGMSESLAEYSETMIELLALYVLRTLLLPIFFLFLCYQVARYIWSTEWYLEARQPGKAENLHHA